MGLAEFVIWAKSLVIHFSYLALFFAGVISSSTLFLPLPVDTLIFFATRLGLNPFLIGIFTGIGAGIGEVTGYLVGVGGKSLIKEGRYNGKLPKQLKILQKAIFETMVGVFKKYLFFVIIIVSFIPFSVDLVGIFAGVVRYDIRKFLVAAIIGKICKYLLIAFVGSWIIGLIGV